MPPEDSRHDRGLAKMREMFGPGIDSAPIFCSIATHGPSASLHQYTTNICARSKNPV